MIVLLCITALLLTNVLFSFGMYVLYAENRQLHTALLRAENPYAATKAEPRTTTEQSELKDKALLSDDIFDGTL